MIYGHGQLSRTLLANGLIDRVRFNLHPVVVGGDAEPLQQHTSAFRLIGARTRDSGVVVLDYLTNAETRVDPRPRVAPESAFVSDTAVA